MKLSLAQKIRQDITDLQAALRVIERYEMTNGHVGKRMQRMEQALELATAAHEERTRGRKKKTPRGGSLKGLTIGDALRKILSDVPRTNPELQVLLKDAGYKHKGSTPLSSRISQEMHTFMKSGAVKATKVSGQGRANFAYSLPDAP